MCLYHVNIIMNIISARLFLLILLACVCRQLIDAQSSLTHTVIPTNFPTNDFTEYIKQSVDGFYWLGNSSGIYRYDGKQWTNYSIKDYASEIEHDQVVTSVIYEDSNGRIWFTTYQALHVFDPANQVFNTFQVSFDDVVIKENYYSFYFDQERGSLLLVAGNSIFAFDIQTYEHSLLHTPTKSNRLRSILEENVLKFYGAPWWNADGLEYFEYRSGGVTNFRTIDLPVMVKEVAPSLGDSLFLATPIGLQLLTNASSLQDFTLETIIQGDARHLTLNKNRQIGYVSIDGKGVTAFNPLTKQVVANWTTSSGLKDDDARKLSTDKFNNIFVSYLEKGIDLIAAGSHWVKSVPLPGEGSICDIATSSGGNVFCIDEEGKLSVLVTQEGNYTNWKKTTYNQLEYSSRGLASFGITPDGSLNLHGSKSLTTISPTGEFEEHLSLPFSIFRGVVSFNDGERLLLGQEGILSVLPNAEPSPVSGVPYGRGHYFSNIVKLNNNRFLASYKEVELWDFRRIGTSWVVQNKYPMAGEMETAISFNDQIYVGSPVGLLAIKADSLVTVLNPTSATGNLWVNSLHADPAGHLWLGTKQGLFCYFLETENYLHFTTTDGLIDDHFIRANVISTDSTFTMATRTGLVTVDVSLADTNVAQNKIYLSDVWINGIRKQDHSLYHPEPLNLDYRRNSLVFMPGMIELLPSKSNGFEYRLKGLEEEFTYSKLGEQLRYPSIPPGKYTFELVGIDKNGRKTAPFTLPVTIAPPFYQTWWFWLLCMSSLLALVFYLNRLAVKRETTRQQLIQKEQARKAAETLARHQAVVTEQRRIMMELHDDLGGTLGSLFYTLDGYLLDKETGLPVEPDFELLKNTSGEAIKQLREVMKNNAAKEMSLNSFSLDIAERARLLAASANLQWKLERDEQFPEVRLSSHLVHNTSLIVKEALQNIRKHSEATFFTIRIKVEQGKQHNLVIELADNGQGISNTTTAEVRTDGTGNGLTNMQRRAASMDGELTISSLTGEGTTLRLRIPLTQTETPILRR